MRNVAQISQKRRGASPGEYTFRDMHELCAFLAHEIAESRYKYNAIASRAGCCASTVSNMAHGQTQFPRASTVFSILQVLGFEVVIRK
jgi:hypothetical protein